MRYGRTSENLQPLSASSKRQEADFKALSSEFQASGREKPRLQFYKLSIISSK
jgi:hypothetical protein